MANEISMAVATQKRELTKAAQTLLGICSGIVADGEINDHEISFLKTWLTENASLMNCWPGSAITKRIDDVLADGVITQEERESLLLALNQISGNSFSEKGAASAEGPVLPIDDDPSIYFRNMTFCFTGNFFFGTRAACERAVMRLEAMPVDRVSGKLDYLVIGSVIEESWVNTTYGRKIELALQRRDRYGLPTIVSEAQWEKAMKDATRS